MTPPPPPLSQTRTQVATLLEQAVAAFDSPPVRVYPLGPLEGSCDDSPSLDNGAELVRVTSSASLLLPAEQAQAQVDVARGRLEANGWPSELTADRRAARLLAPGDYGVLLDIPEDGRILVSISAPCARP